jgi:hypothetical protein
MVGFRYVLVAAVLWSGCQESSFSGSRDPASPTPPQADNSAPKPAVPNDSGPRDPGPCTDETQINSKILSQKFLNGTAGNKIEYRLTLTGCDGILRPITPGSLLFDVNAVRSADKIRGGLRYTLTIGSTVKKGILVSVGGKDLFGKTGSHLYYYQNQEDIPVDSDVYEGTFQVDFEGEKLMRIEDGTSTKFRFETYLKFGPATPIKHTIDAE